MTRIMTEGFELGDNLFWTSGAGAVTTDPTLLMTGKYSCIGGGTKVLPSPLSEVYFRGRFRAQYSQRSCELVAFKSGSTKLGSIRLDGTTGKIYFATGSGTTVTSAGTTTPDLTNKTLIEVYFKLADSDGRVIVKVNGLVDIDYTGDTKPGSETTFDSFSTSGSMTGGGSIAIDDIAVNDTSNSDGLNNNSWCGDGKIVALVPNGNGDQTQLLGSDGNSADNYVLVDEIPVGAAPDDYVESDTADKYDLYRLTDLPAEDSNILRLWVEGRAVDTAGAGGNCQLGIKVAGSGGGGSPATGINPNWSTNDVAWRYGTNNAGNVGVLLVVNIKGRDSASPSSQTLTIPLPPEATSNTVTVIGESRTITASNGTFTDTFNPLAVHAYSIPVSTYTQSGANKYRYGWWIERGSSTANVAAYLEEGQTNFLLGGAFDGNLSQTTPYLTLLQNNNAKGLVGINHGHGVTMSSGTITSVVNTLKVISSVDGYYVADEPETEYDTNFPPSIFASVYETIRAADPDKVARPVVMSFNMIPGTGHEAQIAKIEEYYPYLDAVSMHNYPFEAGDPEFGDGTDRAQYDRWKWMQESANAHGKPFVATCQGFGENFSPYRQPTWNELNYQVMSAVVLGVPTIRYWMDYGNIVNAEMKGFVATLCQNIQLMAEQMNNGNTQGLIGGGGGVVGSSEDWSNNIPLGATTSQIQGKVYQSKPSGGAWTLSDVNSLQAGFKVK